MHSEEKVSLEVRGAVARMLLNRPKQKNALDVETLESLVARLKELESHSEVKVLLLEGAGDAFCVGFDILSMAALFQEEGGPDRQVVRSLALLGEEVVQSFLRSPWVTVASVHGYVMGGGFLLMAACDIRVAAVDTVFSLPEVSLGLPMTWGGIPLLNRELGVSKTRDLLLSGRKFAAAELAGSGFFRSSPAAHERGAITEALLVEISEQPITALRMLKGQFQSYEPLLNQDDAALFEKAITDPSFLSTAVAYLQKVKQK